MFPSQPQQADKVRADAATTGAAAGVPRRAWRVGPLSGAAVLVAMLALALPAGAIAQVSFRGPTNYSAGSTPVSVAVGDFNGGSDPDLAVANYFNGTISVLLGGAGGSFAGGGSFGTGGGPNSVAVGHFNNDSHADLAVVNQGSNNVSLLLGDGNAGFKPASTPTVAVGGSPASVAVGHFNNDSHPDLAVANSSANNVSVLLGDGNAGFKPASTPTVGVGEHPVSVAIGDFDDDKNRDDVAVANQSSRNVSVLLGKGDGTFNSAGNHEVGITPSSVAVDDFNGDSDPDLAVVNQGSFSVSILLGSTGGSFGGGGSFGTGEAPNSVAVGDFNRDSDPDLAVANQLSNNVSVHLGGAGGSFGAANNFPAGITPYSVAVGDFDGKNGPDLAVANELSSNVSVLLNNALPVANDDTYTTDEDTPVRIDDASVLGNDSDADGDSLTAAPASDPDHGSLTVNPDDGSFTYSPAADFNGTDSFSYRASDGAAADTATVTIEVKPVNDAPTAAADTYTTDEDEPFRAGSQVPATAPGVLANDSDLDGDSLMMDLVLGAAHGLPTFFVDGSFAYQPANDFNGTDKFKYRAFDGKLYSETVTVTINVRPVNDAPAARSDSYATDEDTPLDVPTAAGVLSNDSDVEGDALSAAVASGPSQGTLRLGGDGSLSYTPDADYNGIDSFEYLASDGADSGTATVTIEVKATQDATTANGDSYQTGEDTPLSVEAPGVLANDSDPDGALAAGLVSGPSHGSLDLRGDGSLSYTPDPNYNGSDSFEYSASDGAEFGTATVTIEVEAAQDAPAANGDAYATDEDTQLVVEGPGVLANDSDADGDAMAAALVSGPSHGSLELRGDGSLSYTPNAGYNGTDSFSYRAGDGTLDSDAATVTFEVRPVDDAPPAGSAPPAGQARPSADFTIPSGSVRFKNGSTVVTVVVPGPGTVTAAHAPATTARVGAAAKQKALVKRTRKVATKAGPVRLTLKPTEAGQKRLRLKKKLTARIRFTFTPSGGTAKSTFKKVTIKAESR
jgi:VCBS repeat-containing protein